MRFEIFFLSSARKRSARISTSELLQLRRARKHVTSGYGGGGHGRADYSNNGLKAANRIPAGIILGQMARMT